MRLESFLICLAGATATGKSALVQALAEEAGAPILSADAMLVYRGMDVGTAKPTRAERARVPYFGVDVVSPAEPFSAADWLREAEAARRAAEEMARPLFVTGGTGLYFSALLRGLDPLPPRDAARCAELETLSVAELQARLGHFPEVHLPPGDWQNPRRLVRALDFLERGIPLPKAWGRGQKPALCALTWERAQLHERIARRVDEMFRAGLLEETEALRARHPVWSHTAAQAIGYAEAGAVLDGRMTQAEARERIVVRTRQLARRQETYLRHQFEVTWLCVRPEDTLETLKGRFAAVQAGGPCA